MNDPIKRWELIRYYLSEANILITQHKKDIGLDTDELQYLSEQIKKLKKHTKGY